MDAKRVVAFLPEWLQPYLTAAHLTELATAGATALITFLVGWTVAGWVSKFVRRAAGRAELTDALGGFLSSLARYVAIFATIIATADALGFDTTSLVAIFASAGLAVGLALQGSLSNFASGVMILFFRPFGVNDWVTVNGLTAKVTQIGTFATNMMKNDGTKVVVPNSAITSSTIENHTELNKRRATVDIGVAYGTDLHHARDVLAAACEGVEGILDGAEGGKDYAVYFAAFGASSLDFKIHVWSTAPDFLAVQERVRYAVYAGLAEAGIGIPFPQVDVHFDGGAVPQVAAK